MVHFQCMTLAKPNGTLSMYDFSEDKCHMTLNDRIQSNTIHPTSESPTTFLSPKVINPNSESQQYTCYHSSVTFGVLPVKIPRSFYHQRYYILPVKVVIESLMVVSSDPNSENTIIVLSFGCAKVSYQWKPYNRFSHLSLLKSYDPSITKSFRPY
jgi:hypothetical protein